ncbi:MAG: HepT-like ribonuclease domain-containing protein [Caulobacteraceae bacterium]
MAKAAPAIAARVPDLSGAVALRNTLIHGYASVVDEMVWGITQEDLPSLRLA